MKKESTILIPLMLAMASPFAMAQDIQVSNDWGAPSTQAFDFSEDDMSGNSPEEEALLQSLYNEEEDEDLQRMLQSEDYIFPSSITDNWHLIFQAGDVQSWGSYSEEVGFAKKANFGLGLGIGKYLTPVNDVRILMSWHRNTGVHGPDLNGDPEYTTGFGEGPEKEWNGRYDTYHFHSISLYADWLPNITNLILGYEPERKFTVSGVMGIGLEQTFGYTDKDLSKVSVWAESPKRSVGRSLVGLKFGAQVDYILNDRWHLNFEASDIVLDDTYDGLVGKSIWDGNWNLMFGACWYLKGKLKNGRIQNRNPFADKYTTYEERIYKNREAIEDALANRGANISTVNVTKDVTYTLISFDEHVIEVPRLQQNNVYTTAEAYKSIEKSKIFITNSSKTDDKLFHERAWSISKLLHNRWQVPLEDIWVDADEAHIQQLQIPESKHYIILIIND